MRHRPVRIDRAAPPFLRMAPDRRSRIRAGLRCGGFLLLAVLFAALASVVLRDVFGVRADPDRLPSLGLLLGSQSLLALAVVLLPTALMLRIGRDRPIAFGWGTGHRLRHLLIGVAGGIGAVVLLLGAIALFGGASMGRTPLPAGPAIGHALGYALVFLLVAITEEGLLRGYALTMLARAISFWPAAILSCAAFAILHAPHGNETPAGLVDASLAGLLLAFSLWRSGGLWFAWGWHAAWDWSETALFGTSDSGVPTRDPLFSTVLHGPAWLTGGAAGPEASWLAAPVLLLTALLVWLALGRPAPAAD